MRTPDQPHNSTAASAGIEITDSATRFTLTFGASAQARRWHTRLTMPAAPSQAAETIASLLERAARDHNDNARDERVAPTALGVALGNAVVDVGTAIVRSLRQAPNWDHVAFAEMLSQRTGALVQLASATNAAAVAEARVGAGKDILPTDPMLYVLLTRSVTSSLVVSGRYLAGAHGAEGQLGHWLVRPGGPRCSCGAYGHLEPLASGQSLVRNLIGRASASDESTAAMLRVSGGRAEATTAAQVVQLASEGDPAARAVLDEALDALAPALANLVATLDPAAIVVGGPLALAGDGFFAPLRSRLDALCTPFSRAPGLYPAALEPAAALIGARLLATDSGILH